MENFRNITIEDAPILAKYLAAAKHRACDYSVANLVLWSEVYGTEMTIYNDTLFIRFKSGEKTDTLKSILWKKFRCIFNR